MRIATAALALMTFTVLAVPANAAAATHGQTTKCKNDGHKYISGKTATAHHKQASFVGTLARFHPCGEDDGYFTSHKKTITLTLLPSSKILVFKNELNPSAYKTVTAAEFPHSFTKNKDEPIYQFSGPSGAVNTLREHFVS